MAENVATDTPRRGSSGAALFCWIGTILGGVAGYNLISIQAVTSNSIFESVAHGLGMLSFAFASYFAGRAIQVARG